MPPEKDENNNTDWKSSLPEDLREHTALKDVKDVAGLAKSFVDTQSYLGNAIRIPGENAGEDDRKAFYEKLTTKVPGLIPTPDPENPEAMNALFKRMGRPDDPNGYEVPEGVEPEKVADFAKMAHELGLNKAQFKKIVGSLGQAAATRQEQNQQEHQKELRALKQEWGITYEDNMELVGAVLQGTGAPPELQELAADRKLPVQTVKWLHAIGKQLGSEGVNFNKQESSTRVTPAEARAQIEEIMNDRNGPYWNKADPRHRDMVNKVVELHRAASAGG